MDLSRERHTSHTEYRPSQKVRGQTLTPLGLEPHGLFIFLFLFFYLFFYLFFLLVVNFVIH